MQKEVTTRNLVSVIIPCYNGEVFIKNTIESVLVQTHPFFEIIIVNDGSTDNTEKIAFKYTEDKRVKYFLTENKGVSSARNFGLEKASGDFVVFLDADDILEPQFIKKRILFLQNHPNYSACCTSLQIIDENGNLKPQSNIGVHDNMIKQILSYKALYATCPSNYLFNRKILTSNNLLFDVTLSSSADRYFLIEASKYLRVGLIFNDKDAKLLYRIHSSNMSRVISVGLLNDNKLFMKKIFNLKYIPTDYKNIFRFKIYYILSGGNFKLKNISAAFFYAILATLSSPNKFIKQLCAE